MFDQQKPLHASVAQAFIRAIRRISGARPAIDEEGERTIVSQEQLAEDAGMARSSLTKLLKQDDAANPTLKSICQIANALGVPPAFLLMRDRDWKVLAAAVFTHEAARTDPRFNDFAKRLCTSKDHGPSASVQNGRELARLTNHLQELPAGADKMVRSNVEAQAYRIGATSAAPPLQQLHTSNPEYVPLLLTLCAAMGANFRD
ncbi:helix-turn-helix transcriptional regulator [Stenotrophomonas sp.]|uniref:helix-turn-helix domain-containing protein n=1 Tax=Stenotrophomonas sp. TaxID=69392 RepID=UPI002D5541FA|nr:helix-turn-helix transcriptional regulator [Stenotrophomonas sp.]HYQ23046.1 helix-turn-helix transcriptional regulator [Stenotrophomonas sp.]